MTAKEIATDNMHHALLQFLDDNATVYANDKAFTTAVNAFKNSVAYERTFGSLLATDTTAFSAEKAKIKNQMATEVAHLAGYAYVALNSAGKTKEASQLSIHISDYEQLSDVEAQNLAQSNLDLMNLQTSIITPDYVTAADLTNLGTTISNFAAAKGSAESINKATPAQRAAFKTALANTAATVDDLRLLVRKYLSSNKVFHDALINESTILNVNIHHTTLNVFVNSKADGTAIANATATLSHSKKTGTSDVAGNIVIEEISGGTATLTITATGYKDCVQQIKIASGKENHVEVGMEKV